MAVSSPADLPNVFQKKIGFNDVAAMRQPIQGCCGEQSD